MSHHLLNSQKDKMPTTKSRFYRIISSLESLLPYWRGANLTVLMIAVFAPWLPGSGEMGSVGSGDPFGYPGWFILTLLVLRPPALIGLLSYLILSLCKFINSSSWLRCLLFILASINFLSFAWLTWFMFEGDLLWGYWLICASVLSSLILETIDLYLLVEKGKISSAIIIHS